MDLREKKTKKHIHAAFLALRKKKALERITVKELAELAEISKATFYLHYKDIYDLSETLQNGVIQEILRGIEHPEYCLTDTKTFTQELFSGFGKQYELVETLFSGFQSAVLPTRIEQELLAFLENIYPNIDIKTEMLITYSIHGTYSIYLKYGEIRDIEEVVNIAGIASETILKSIQ